MSALDQVELRPLNSGQLRALALMQVDVYQRRHLAASAVAAVSANVSGWSAADCSLPLARAVARAGGMIDAAAWSSAWLQAGLLLPGLAELRAEPATKRMLWRQMRSRR